jgi:hypothetical protein
MHLYLNITLFVGNSLHSIFQTENVSGRSLPSDYFFLGKFIPYDYLVFHCI